MSEDTKDFRSEQPGSHSQSEQPSPDQKKGNQSRENQFGNQIPKKHVHGEKQDEENQKTGTQTGTG